MYVCIQTSPRVLGVFYYHADENSTYINTFMYIVYTYYIHTCVYILRVFREFSEYFILTFPQKSDVVSSTYIYEFLSNSNKSIQVFIYTIPFMYIKVKV